MTSDAQLVQLHVPLCMLRRTFAEPPSRLADGGKRRKLEAAGDDGLAARINRELERSLRDFVALATVSRDPGYREDCFRGAKFLGTLLESLGALAHRLCLALSPPAAPT